MNLDPESERLAGGRPFRFRRIDFEFQIVLVDHRRRLKCDSLFIKCNLGSFDHISTADDELQISVLLLNAVLKLVIPLKNLSILTYSRSSLLFTWFRESVNKNNVNSNDVKVDERLYFCNNALEHSKRKWHIVAVSGIGNGRDFFPMECFPIRLQLPVFSR